MADNEQPKIVTDDDWKQELQAEKEKLVTDDAGKDASGGAEAGAGGAGGPGAQKMPDADFGGLMDSLAMQAVLYLGGFPDPQTGKAVISLEHAKYYIDMLAVLQEKTKGNLSDEEASLIDRAVSELRMQFVEVTKAVAAHMEEQAKGGGPGAGGIVGG